jgi:hypothetical protein
MWAQSPGGRRITVHARSKKRVPQASREQNSALPDAHVRDPWPISQSCPAGRTRASSACCRVGHPKTPEYGSQFFTWPLWSGPFLTVLLRISGHVSQNLTGPRTLPHKRSAHSRKNTNFQTKSAIDPSLLVYVLLLLRPRSARSRVRRCASGVSSVPLLVPEWPATRPPPFPRARCACLLCSTLVCFCVCYSCALLTLRGITSAVDALAACRLCRCWCQSCLPPPFASARCAYLWCLNIVLSLLCVSSCGRHELAPGWACIAPLPSLRTHALPHTLRCKLLWPWHPPRQPPWYALGVPFCVCWEGKGCEGKFSLSQSDLSHFPILLFFFFTGFLVQGTMRVLQ